MPNQTPNHETSILKLLQEEPHLRDADSTAAGARRTRSFCVVPQRLWPPATGTHAEVYDARYLASIDEV